MSVRKIARLARLSPSAVSLALNDSPKIPEKTKQRIRLLATKVGYKPNTKLHEVMAQVRASGGVQAESCLAVISLYDCPNPWDLSPHHAEIYESMKRRAHALGYRLEPMWLRAPGMTYRRFRGILDARGIKGILCFGSPVLEDVFPVELDHYAIVTVGMSIKTALHRVVSHSYKDMLRVLEKVHELGYRKPGLAISRYEDVRSVHAYSSAYLGWCERRGEAAAPIPVLRLEAVEDKALWSWAREHSPDVVIFVPAGNELAGFAESVVKKGIQVPRDLGVAVVGHQVRGTAFSGLQQNQSLMGAWAIELLVSRIQNQDFGIPLHPRIEMVESEWLEGKSLRKQGVRPRSHKSAC